MVVPDYAYISEILLFSEGFLNATSLAVKMTNCFKLASEQLSDQNHYDFGLRTVRTVISVAGNIKRSSKSSKLSEEEILLKALRDVNVPKLIDHDIPVFMGMLTDLFPSTQLLKSEYGGLSANLAETITEMGLQPTPSLLTKCYQLYDILTARHGVMLVGGTYSGKTTCYRVLARALSRQRESPEYRNVEFTTINPKAISIDQLFGRMTNSMDWTDGILSNIMRELAKDNDIYLDHQTEGNTSQHQDDTFHWIVLDGPVDPIWVENMNTALDDNKLLCLSNGERIPILPNSRFVFEVSDLLSASPATISRVGIVYMGATLSWTILIKVSFYLFLSKQTLILFQLISLGYNTCQKNYCPSLFV
jgi:dynein heavy chain